MHAPLHALETHLNLLITSLSQTNTFSNAPQIAADLVADDDRLTAALNDLQRHQENWARIDALRAEAASLEDLLKDQIRQTVAFRQNIVSIHPSIEESEDDEEEEEEAEEGEKPKEIDYQTLLAFAARIGKHNAAAAREAEAEAARNKMAAKKQTNGAGVGGDNVTAETSAELDRINNSVAQTRAQMGMAFPDANLLRVGALGQLQLLRERQQTLENDEKSIQAAVDREVEKMVRQTEDIADDPTEVVGDRTDEVPEDAASSYHQQGNAVDQSSAQRVSAGLPSALATRPPKRKKVDLDFPSSDEEDVE